MKLNKVVSGIIVGGLLLTAGGISMASASDIPAKFSKMVSFQQDGQHRPGPGYPGQGQPKLTNENMKEVLGHLVSDGTLTQEQVDKFQAYIDETVTNAEGEEKNRQEKRPDLFKDAVDKGIITQEQANIITNKIKEKGQEIRQEKIKTQLNTLVTSGTITQAQADGVLQAFEVSAAKRQEVLEKVKDMTPEEMQSHIQSLKKENINPLSQMVSDKTITQEQADAIAKLMPHRGGHFKFKGVKGAINNDVTE